MRLAAAKTKPFGAFCKNRTIAIMNDLSKHSSPLLLLAGFMVCGLLNCDGTHMVYADGSPFVSGECASPDRELRLSYLERGTVYERLGRLPDVREADYWYLYSAATGSSPPTWMRVQIRCPSSGELLYDSEETPLYQEQCLIIVQNVSVFEVFACDAPMDAPPAEIHRREPLWDSEPPT